MEDRTSTALHVLQIATMTLASACPQVSVGRNSENFCKYLQAPLIGMGGGGGWRRWVEWVVEEVGGVGGGGGWRRWVEVGGGGWGWGMGGGG